MNLRFLAADTLQKLVVLAGLAACARACPPVHHMVHTAAVPLQVPRRANAHRGSVPGHHGSHGSLHVDPDVLSL
jgi:hypothetical protein